MIELDLDIAKELNIFETLTIKKSVNTRIVFDKDKVVEEIQCCLGEDFPHWYFVTSPDTDFSLILLRSIEVQEETTNSLNPFSQYTNVKERTYQIVVFLDVTDKKDEKAEKIHPTGSRILYVDSYKTLKRFIEKIDKKEEV